ncbi:MAG: 3D domain-containing protein [Verrucomicrobiota bacterium]
MVVRTTAYSDKENEKGAYKNQTCIGTVLRYGKVYRTAAADWSRYPLGTKFKIKGQPYIYVVEDYGSALVGTGTLDLYKPTLSSMRAWGARHVEIEIVEWGDYEKSLHILSRRKKYPHCLKMYNGIKAKMDA